MSQSQQMAVERALDAPALDPIRHILVADDDPQLRLMVQRILLKQGYRVTAFADGEAAVAACLDQLPDLVLLDVMMPVMDGYDAAKQIKLAASHRFVPIIFLTALSDESDLVRCLQAGGDGVLTKPFSAAFLQAEIDAMERMRKLYLHQQWQSDALRKLNAQVQHEHEVAEQIFSYAVSSRNVTVPGLKSWIQPAATFNGDLMLTAYHPAGGLYILLGDFTGHGLGAAIGALPVSEAFHSMINKGFDPASILEAINQKLYTLLPSGIFLAALFVSVSPDFTTLEVWNGGLPPALLVDGNSTKIKTQLRSRNLPLGIKRELRNNRRIERWPVQAGDYLLVYSDGLVEARDLSGDAMWGEDRLQAVVESCERTEAIFDAVLNALSEFTQGATQADDVSVIGIPCRPEVLAMANKHLLLPTSQSASLPVRVNTETVWSVELSGQEIAQCNPVRLLINHLASEAKLDSHLTTLQTVMRELYNNAVDHGILRLDSHLKGSAEGFEAYYVERDRRLQRLKTGYLRMELRINCEPRPQAVTVRVTDSGDGFDFDKTGSAPELPGCFFGRGIPLVRNLCSQVQWLGQGNDVEAVLSLDAD